MWKLQSGWKIEADFVDFRIIFEEFSVVAAQEDIWEDF